jgi:hypothetical protein
VLNSYFETKKATLVGGLWKGVFPLESFWWSLAGTNVPMANAHRAPQPIDFPELTNPTVLSKNAEFVPKTCTDNPTISEIGIQGA